MDCCRWIPSLTSHLVGKQTAYRQLCRSAVDCRAFKMQDAASGLNMPRAMLLRRLCNTARSYSLFPTAEENRVHPIPP